MIFRGEPPLPTQFLTLLPSNQELTGRKRPKSGPYETRALSVIGNHWR
jgi:hypothetical protein